MWSEAEKFNHSLCIANLEAAAVQAFFVALLSLFVSLHDMMIMVNRSYSL